MAGSAEVSYGSGHRSGVLRLETKEAEGRVLVVGEAVPWWLLVTARLSWPVLRTWFEKPPPVFCVCPIVLPGGMCWLSVCEYHQKREGRLVGRPAPG